MNGNGVFRGWCRAEFQVLSQTSRALEADKIQIRYLK
jgi:hypothetical protein